MSFYLFLLLFIMSKKMTRLKETIQLQYWVVIWEVAYCICYSESKPNLCVLFMQSNSCLDNMFSKTKEKPKSDRTWNKTNTWKLILMLDKVMCDICIIATLNIKGKFEFTWWSKQNSKCLLLFSYKTKVFKFSHTRIYYSNKALATTLFDGGKEKYSLTWVVNLWHRAHDNSIIREQCTARLLHYKKLHNSPIYDEWQALSAKGLI